MMVVWCGGKGLMVLFSKVVLVVFAWCNKMLVW